MSKRYEALNSKTRSTLRVVTMMKLVGSLTNRSHTNVLTAMAKVLKKAYTESELMTGINESIQFVTIQDIWWKLTYDTADEIEMKLRRLMEEAEERRIQWGFEHFQELYEEAAANEGLQADLPEARDLTPYTVEVWPDKETRVQMADERRRLEEEQA